jgi:macrolide transport system ATP-binding/permease protein
MVLRQGSILVLAGIVIGFLISMFSGRLVNNFLFGVKAVDLWTYVAVAIVLMFTGLLATIIPAHRASTVEPMEALRDE